MSILLRCFGILECTLHFHSVFEQRNHQIPTRWKWVRSTRSSFATSSNHSALRNRVLNATNPSPSEATFPRGRISPSPSVKIFELRISTAFGPQISCVFRLHSGQLPNVDVGRRMKTKENENDSENDIACSLVVNKHAIYVRIVWTKTHLEWEVELCGNEGQTETATLQLPQSKRTRQPPELAEWNARKFANSWAQQVVSFKSIQSGSVRRIPTSCFWHYKISSKTWKVCRTCNLEYAASTSVRRQWETNGRVRKLRQGRQGQGQRVSQLPEVSKHDKCHLTCVSWSMAEVRYIDDRHQISTPRLTTDFVGAKDQSTPYGAATWAFSEQADADFVVRCSCNRFDKASLRSKKHCTKTPSNICSETRHLCCPWRVWVESRRQYSQAWQGCVTELSGCVL